MDKVEVKVEEGVKELVIREGQALPLANTPNLNIAGVINAPSEFIKARNADFKINKSNCQVNRNARRIDLYLNEDSPFGTYHISGHIYLGNKFKALGINDSEVSYTPRDLAKKLKMLRSIFDSRTEHAAVINSLRDIKAKLKQDLDAKDDNRGNLSASFEQTLESNIPEKFTINIPLIEGQKPTKFDVHIFIEGSSYNDLRCYLESVDAADMIEESVEKLIDAEVKIIKEYAVVIEQ